MRTRSAQSRCGCAPAALRSAGMDADSKKPRKEAGRSPLPEKRLRSHRAGRVKSSEARIPAGRVYTNDAASFAAPNRKFMLDNLTERLGRIIKGLRGEARLTDANIQEALREVRMVLLEADVALPVV